MANLITSSNRSKLVKGATGAKGSSIMIRASGDDFNTVGSKKYQFWFASRFPRYLAPLDFASEMSESAFLEIFLESLVSCNLSIETTPGLDS